MFKRLILPLLLTLLALAPAAPALAQADQLAKHKALLTLSFIRYMSWSDAARQGDFVIGVLKDRDLEAQLKQLSAGKKFGLQNVVILGFKNLEELRDCQIIYVSHNISFSRNIQAILDKVGKDTLVMSEEEGAVRKGSMVNFVIREDKLRFELSKKNAKLSNIGFASKLTEMAAAINID